MQNDVNGGVEKEYGGIRDIGEPIVAADSDAEGEVELRSPGRKCPGCGKRAEVVVLPEGLCGDCSSKKAIATWKVMRVREMVAGD